MISRNHSKITSVSCEICFQVKKLRERTGAPLSECREALLALSKETTDPTSALDKAVEILRKKGVSVAGKKAGRKTHILCRHGHCCPLYSRSSSSTRPGCSPS